MSLNINSFDLYLLFGCGAGVYFIFYGFKRLHLKRLIEDLPTSRIKSMALGLVEVKGSARSVFKIQTPFSNIFCPYYRYRVQEYRRNSKGGGYWTTILQGDSSQYPFFVEDDSGCALVLPKGIDADLKWVQVFKSEPDFMCPPAHIADFLESKHINVQTWIFNKTIKVEEAYLMEMHPIYMLGYAQPWKVTTGSEEAKQIKRFRWLREMQKLKKDPNRLKQFDLNNDGHIDTQEWEIAKKKIASQVQEKFGTEVHNLMQIEHGPKNSVFYLSEKSEMEILSSFGIMCPLSIIGGAVLSLGTIAIFLYKFFRW